MMYKKHTHMVNGELHILPNLVLDKNANDNAYSSPLALCGLEYGPQKGNAGN